MTKTVLLFVAVMAAGAVSANPKYIYTGWDLGDVTPQEVLSMADAFDKSACDGVALRIGGALPGRDGLRMRKIVGDPGWKYDEVKHFEPVFREIVKHPSLRESLLFLYMSPTNRLSWKDDLAWAAFAGNVAVHARLARRGGLKGVITDFEDYYRQKQYVHSPEKDGGTFAEACRLARRRGREVFKAAFAEFPEMSVLTFQLFTADTRYARRRDPVAMMVENRDLWPAFVNGILDVMPPTATITDGNEGFGYLARADRQGFYRGACDQRVGVLPLVAAENRAKYQAQVKVGFGLYMDSYSLPTNSSYYFGPVNGKRIHHFEDNLRQATACADGYIWFWGEKGLFIDWPADLKERSGNTWRSTGGGTWRRKYFEGSWGRVLPWRKLLDGDFDQMALGVKDPARFVRAAFAERPDAPNLFSGSLSDKPGALMTAQIGNVGTEEWYGVRVKGRGEVLRLRGHFKQSGKGWRWDLGEWNGSFGAPDADGWREGVMLVRIPAEADILFLHLDSGEVKVPVEYKDLQVIRIK